MKRTVDFIFEDQIINYKINSIGVERITLNGNLASKKWSFGKMSHPFSITTNNEVQACRIDSKVNYTTSLVTLLFFVNDLLIATKEFLLFNNKGGEKKPSESDNVMFVIGLMFIVLGISIDASELYILAGLLFILHALTSKNANSDCCQNEKDTHNKY